MKSEMPPGMVEVTRLTREGRLGEATRLIQRLLQKTGEPSRADDASRAARRALPNASVARSAAQQAADFGDGAVSRAGRRDNQRSAQRRTQPTARVPQGAQFITQTFTNQLGSRDYKLFTPSRCGGDTLPLIVMLHGCTQSADDFAVGTRMNQVAEECRCLVAYPIQPPAANPSKCWNWFKTENQQRDGGEAALIADLTRHIAHNYAIDRKRIYVAGLSAGGAAAAILGTTYPDLYAAVGVHSGLACGAASDLSSALAVMHQGPSGSVNPARRSSGFHGRARLAPTIVFHGARDRIVHPQNAAQIVEQLVAAEAAKVHPATHRGHVSGGHTYSRTIHTDASGRVILEMWVIDGAAHAWSGGDAAGSFTDPRGPDASREMVRFFLQHPHPRKAQ